MSGVALRPQVKLGMWLTNRRQDYKKGALFEDMQRAMEDAVGRTLKAQLWGFKRVGINHSPETWCEAVRDYVVAKKELPSQKQEWTYLGHKVRAVGRRPRLVPLPNLTGSRN